MNKRYDDKLVPLHAAADHLRDFSAERYVALATPDSREVLFGMSEYLVGKERWSFDYMFTWAYGIEQQVLEQWGGSGIIIRTADPDLLKRIRAAGYAVVNTAHADDDTVCPTFRPDDVAIGRLGAAYLAERGLKNLVICTDAGGPYARDRVEGFLAEASDQSLQAKVFNYADPASGGSNVLFHLKSLLLQEPKPLGLMGVNDVIARTVSRCCFESRLPVPEDVAILGVDNDEALCSLDFVPLSSIQPDAKRAGFLAARTMDRLLGGEDPQKISSAKIPPLGVVSRRSTDMLAHEHPAVRRALSYIREHCTENIRIDETARYAHVSKRTLERLFKKELGRSPVEQLIQERLQVAQHLLSSTNLSVGDVAEQSGFDSHRKLGEWFRRKHAMTPSVYRKQFSISE